MKYSEILDMKIRKVKNIDIADIINKKWGKSYTANYISYNIPSAHYSEN